MSLLFGFAVEQAERVVQQELVGQLAASMELVELPVQELRVVFFLFHSNRPEAFASVVRCYSVPVFYLVWALQIGNHTQKQPQKQL